MIASSSLHVAKLTFNDSFGREHLFLSRGYQGSNGSKWWFTREASQNDFVFIKVIGDL